MRGSIYINIQKKSENAYWLTRIKDGISAYALSRRMSVEEKEPGELRRGDMLIIVGTEENSLISETLAAESCGLRPLIINATVPNALSGRCSASFSIECAVRDCARYLLQLGCKRCALVGTNPFSATDLVKREVFAYETKRLGMDSFIAENSALPLTQTLDAFTEKIQSGQLCDSILCANDTAAILLSSRLAKLGINFGKDFPVIGMGNSHIGQRMRPSLTSVDFDYFALGEEAAKLYCYAEKMQTASGASVSVSLPATLIVRDSTGGLSFEKNQISPESLEKENKIFEGDECEMIIALENYLQSCDDLERSLIFSSYERYSELSDWLFVSERTLKYRMANILARLSLPTKDALAEYVKRLLGK